jgi:O-antigen ligase
MSHQTAKPGEIGQLQSAGKFVVPAILIIAAVAVIAGAPAPVNAGLLAIPVAAILLVLYPILIPFALIASVPIQDIIPVPDEVPITATRVISAGAAALLPFILIRQTAPARWSKFLLAILVLLAAMVLSLWNAEFLAPGYAELYRWFVPLAFFWVILQFVRTRRHVILLLGLSGVLAIAQGSLGLIQALTGAGPASFQVGDGFSRAFGTFGMPNSFAAYMEVTTLPLIPVAVWAAARFVSRWKEYRTARWHGYIASIDQRREMLLSLGFLAVLGSSVVIGLGAIALSFSRGGWLGTIAALAVIVILLGRRAIFTSVIAGTLLAIAFMATAPGAVVSEVQERFSQLVDQVQIGDVRRVAVTDDNFATVERMSHWQTAIAMWDEYPWIGIGAGNYNERFTEFAVHPTFDESQGHAHNYYLHVLAETGLIGLFAYLALLLAAFAISWKAYRAGDGLSRAIGIGALGMTVALVVHNVFENLHVLNISLHMMLVWALALIAVRWMPGEAEAQIKPASESSK